MRLPWLTFLLFQQSNGYNRHKIVENAQRLFNQVLQLPDTLTTPLNDVSIIRRRNFSFGEKSH